VTFNTPFNSEFFWHNLMSNKQAIIWPGMAFNAPYLTEVQTLIRQPIVLLNYIDLFPVSK
jgi:hypothetical protein